MTKRSRTKQREKIKRKEERNLEENRNNAKGDDIFRKKRKTSNTCFKGNKSMP